MLSSSGQIAAINSRPAYVGNTLGRRYLSAVPPGLVDTVQLR